MGYIYEKYEGQDKFPKLRAFLIDCRHGENCGEGLFEELEL